MYSSIYYIFILPLHIPDSIVLVRPGILFLWLSRMIADQYRILILYIYIYIIICYDNIIQNTTYWRFCFKYADWEASDSNCKRNSFLIVSLAIVTEMTIIYYIYIYQVGMARLALSVWIISLCHLVELGETILNFGVKFFTPDPSQMQDEYTRYLFALQVKRNISDGTLPCSETTALELASYITQGKYILCKALLSWCDIWFGIR